MFSKVPLLSQQRKVSLRNSKSYTCQRHTSQITCNRPSYLGLPAIRRGRMGSQQLTLSKRFNGAQTAKVLGKSARKLRSHNSEEFLATRYRKSNSAKQPRMFSPKKIHEKGNQMDQQTHQNTRQNKLRKPKQNLIQNYWIIMDSDYRRYQIISRKLPENEIYDLDKLFKRKYKNYMNFLSLINFCNRVTYQKRKKRHYTIFVDKGNNSPLVKHIFASRFWWTVAENKNSQVDMFWSQKKKQECINQIGKLEETLKATQLMVSQNNRQSSHPASRIGKAPTKSTIADYLTLMSQADLEMAIQRDLFSKTRIKWKELRTIKGRNIKCKSVEFTHNHLQMGSEVGHKKQLFKNLKIYLESQNKDPFEVVPLTFHIEDLNSAEFINFKKHFQTKQEAKRENSKLRNIWIVKPGQNSNRGTGIQVFRKIEDIVEHIASTKSKSSDRTFIVQQYLIPFLFFKRKFDIRCYLLITSGHSYRAYFYRDGYLRTSSQQFSFRKLSSKLIHLTNDAVQKKSEQYGKFEKGNKISFSEFQRYLDLTNPELNFQQMIYPKLKRFATYIVEATYEKMQNSKQYTFEIFGLDFMIDENFKPWLIQVNCNPCLELSSPLLQVLIPSMLQNSLRIAVDPIFPPPDMNQWPNSQKICCYGSFLESNRYELIFDSEQTQRYNYKTVQQHRRQSSKDDFSCSSSSIRRD